MVTAMVVRMLRPLGLSGLLLIPLACGDDDGSATGSGTDEGTSTTTSEGSSTTEAPTENQPPPMPMLVSPLDASEDVGVVEEETVAAELCWELVEDPDGDPVRYRVWLDDIELTEGKLETEPGWPGPCLGPLSFNYAQRYAWRVTAFDPTTELLDDAGNRTGWGSESEPSQTFSFTTIRNEASTVLFEDDFEEDRGWTVDGDANGGHWELGDPTPAEYEGAVSSPEQCAGQDGCYFTGVNMEGYPNIADVRGGTTTLTSPPIDLSGVETVSVQVSRFFFKSEFPETGTQFRAEIVLPDPDAPTGEQSFVLEELESELDASGANMWTPVEYSGCGVPMQPEARLRLTATDLGEGILEAAIDNVVVTGFFDHTLCDGGLGSVCDPNATAPCAEGLGCCAQGVLNKGVFRCAELVPQQSYPNAGNEPGQPGTGELSCHAPDLFATTIDMDVWEDELFVPMDACTLYEGCVDGPGWRRLLRFDTITPNKGSRDLVMGVPSNHPDLFHYSDCHGHYHFDGYAQYDLLDGEDHVASGHKQAFCLLDWNPWAWPDDEQGYNCVNQGISSGWQDVYSGNLDCNWIDITDVEPGDYTLRLSINAPREDTAVPLLVESDYSNNVLDVPVTIEGP